ncbi:MAG: hypothetical protein KGJ23_16040 [Euryarchaeota archaeon]|nr:hypothetical protein [Euryarchaeota archaeon]MDE1838109.1 hypothetical protein [Euryarchaeota archaeon]MDE2046715.1 hypothetical protein [Thermoplasmata archaeon]
MTDLRGHLVAHPGILRGGLCTYCHGWHAWVLTHPSDLCGSSDASDLEAALPPRFSARPVDVAAVEEVLATPADWMSEVRAREAACLPGSEWDDG